MWYSGSASLRDGNITRVATRLKDVGELPMDHSGKTLIDECYSGDCMSIRDFKFPFPHN